MRITKLTRRSWLLAQQGGALPHRRRTRGSVRGGASGFQCTASKIRTSLPADHCRPIRRVSWSAAILSTENASSDSFGSKHKKKKDRETRRHRNHGNPGGRKTDHLLRSSEIEHLPSSMASNEPQHTHGNNKGGASRSTDGCPISGQQSHTGAWIYALVYALILFRVEGCIVKITYVENAVAEGAVCLDGSPPAYHLSPGFGIGVNNWLVHLEGGAWCNNVTTCLDRKTTELGSSKYMEKLHNFSGILGNDQLLNPDFYNWNRVLVRYCDGSSFTGDVDTVDPATYLHYRGARIWLAVMEDLLAKGMYKAENALLSGCSAGGLASMLHCDRFHTLFQMGAKVKCLSDAGFFIHVKDIAGREHIKTFFSDVVKTHGSAKHLPSLCTSRFEPSMCFFPQYMAQLIETPLFIQNSAYDAWQITHILVPNDVDPDGAWSGCKLNIHQCSSTQLQTIQDFRIEFLNALSSLGVSSSRGMFINSCYAHCQTEYQATWFGANSLTLENITIGEAVGNWFYDRSSCQKIDCPYPCNPSCDNGGFDDWKHGTQVNFAEF